MDDDGEIVIDNDDENDMIMATIVTLTIITKVK